MRTFVLDKNKDKYMKHLKITHFSQFVPFTF
jgi:hypothetical protein